MLLVALTVMALTLSCAEHQPSAVPAVASTSVAAPTSTSGSSATAAPPTTANIPSTTPTNVRLDSRTQLTRRLTAELDDEALAITVVAGLNDELVQRLERLAGGDIAGTPTLAYAPTRVSTGAIDSLWVFAYGYRIDPASGEASVPLGGAPPPIGAVLPGPTNEELARLAAEFVAEHPVPVIAQWEVARVLKELGVENVISVEPDVAADGAVIYLSTYGVAEKGLRLAAAAGVTVGHAGVLCHADHAVRCVLTARAAGITADVPEGAALPAGYDLESGQEWTRSRATWIPVDLFGRSLLAR
jgi:hypothetical protein